MHMLTYEDRASDLEYGRQDTGLPHGQDLGADRRAEGVGHVVGADAEGQDKGHDETHHYQP